MAAQSQTSAGLHFHMMGPLTIFHSEIGHIESLNRKEAALLCYLKINGRSCSRRELEALFWPDSKKPQVSLRVAINHLRQAYVEPFLEISDEAMTFNHKNHWSDVEALQYQLQQIEGRPQSDLPALMHIVDACGDEFLPQFSRSLSQEFLDWRGRQQARIEQILIRALEQLLRLCSEQDDAENAQKYALRLANLAPWHRNARAFLAQVDAVKKENLADTSTELLSNHFEQAAVSPEENRQELDVIVGVNIQVLSLDEAREFLCLQAGLQNIDASDAVIESLWDVVERHPMAFVLVGRLLRERPYLKLTTVTSKLAHLSTQIANPGLNTGLAAALLLSFQGMKSSAKELLHKIAKFESPEFMISDLTTGNVREKYAIQDDVDYLLRFAMLQKTNDIQYQIPKQLLLFRQVIVDRYQAELEQLN